MDSLQKKGVTQRQSIPMQKEVVLPCREKKAANRLQDESYLHLDNLSLLLRLYEKYIANPESIDSCWRYFFSGFALGQQQALPTATTKELALHACIDGYRREGHRYAKWNPLSDPIPTSFFHSFVSPTQWKPDQSVPAFGFMQRKSMRFDDLMAHLDAIYCSFVGMEYMHITDQAKREWWQHSLEQSSLFSSPTTCEQTALLQLWTKAVEWEEWLQKKCPGQKRFSLEGGEVLIALLDYLIHSTEADIALAMAHRGRLNVLFTLFNASYADLFRTFQGKDEQCSDVPYHWGQMTTITTREKREKNLFLLPNPSHLEAVGSVLGGFVRAKREKESKTMLPILIHGDAAFAGQGVVYETLQQAKLSNYHTGGTLHFIINNQIGFTAEPKEFQSTKHCTDIAKAFDIPIFHIHAEQPEAGLAILKRCLDFRNRFHSDVIVDLVGYRRRGHNEMDNPAYTQPTLYQKIEKRKSALFSYAEQLDRNSAVSTKEWEKWKQAWKKEWENHWEKVTKEPIRRTKFTSLSNRAPSVPCLSSRQWKQLIQRAFSIPGDVNLHPKIGSIIEKRQQECTKSTGKIDWATGEYLALASLLWQGVNIRFSGQDVERGTFSQRHAILVDQKTAKRFSPLSHLKLNQGNFSLFNSPLSEYGALGFEYGYSLSVSSPSLVIWEAQFGDFCNGAQIIIDQFLASGEKKWRTQSGLTLLLPHGYEGQGPEHSSGRMERFCQLAAENNMTIAVPSTPAQFFHCLRRQAYQTDAKPLVVFSPKMLLRHSSCVSSFKEISQGSFAPILFPRPPSRIDTLLFCSGKIFYELMERDFPSSFLVLRLEQIYPFPSREVNDIIHSYPDVKRYLWLQEEPRNMGLWSFLSPHLQALLPSHAVLEYRGRADCASVSNGNSALHRREQTSLFQF